MVSAIQETSVEERVRLALRLVLSEEKPLNEFRVDTERAVLKSLRNLGVTFVEGSLDRRASGITLSYKSENQRQILYRISMRGSFNSTPLQVTEEKQVQSGLDTVQAS